MLDFTAFIKPQNQINLRYTWNKKLESLKEKNYEGYSADERMMFRYEEQLGDMRDSNMMSGIDAKIQAGIELTGEELEYLRQKAPAKYQSYMEAKQEEEAYAEKLKHCKTKEDVQRVNLTEMGKYLAEAKSVSNNANIPKSKKLEMMSNILSKVISVNKIHQEFVQSSAYQELPTEAEVRKEEHEKAEEAKAEQMAAAEESEETEETEETEENAEAKETGETKEDRETAKTEPQQKGQEPEKASKKPDAEKPVGEQKRFGYDKPKRKSDYEREHPIDGPDVKRKRKKAQADANRTLTKPKATFQEAHSFITTYMKTNRGVGQGLELYKKQ